MPDISLCMNHDCPAIHSCCRYCAHHIASVGQSYFRPEFSPKKSPPCRYYDENGKPKAAPEPKKDDKKENHNGNLF